MEDTVTASAANSDKESDAAKPSPRRRWRRFKWFLVLTMAAMVVFRETGCIDVNLHKTEQTSTWNSSMSKTQMTINGQGVDLATVALDVQLKGDTGGTVASTLGETLQKLRPVGAGGGNGQLSVNIKKLDVSGFHWLPLYKTGGCDFDIEVSLSTGAFPGSTTSVNATFRGKIDLSVTGVCSSHRFHEIIGQEIAEGIVERIRK